MLKEREQMILSQLEVAKQKQSRIEFMRNQQEQLKQRIKYELRKIKWDQEQTQFEIQEVERKLREVDTIRQAQFEVYQEQERNRFVRSNSRDMRINENSYNQREPINGMMHSFSRVSLEP